MIDRTYSIAEAQEQFIQLPEQLEQEPGVMIVTQHDKPVNAPQPNEPPVPVPLSQTTAAHPQPHSPLSGKHDS